MRVAPTGTQPNFNQLLPEATNPVQSTQFELGGFAWKSIGSGYTPAILQEAVGVFVGPGVLVIVGVRVGVNVKVFVGDQVGVKVKVLV